MMPKTAMWIVDAQETQAISHIILYDLWIKDCLKIMKHVFMCIFHLSYFMSSTCHFPLKNSDNLEIFMWWNFCFFTIKEEINSK